jgi:hypothetical protein
VSVKYSVRKTRLKDVESAVAEIHRAKKQLAAARRRLTNLTYPDSPHVILSPEYRSIHQALPGKAARLLRISGVIGYGVGRVVRNGMPLDELCVTVFVEQKVSPAELRKHKLKAIPRSLMINGKKVRIDVVPLGRITPQAVAGESLGTAPPAAASGGTIGAFAVENSTKNTVAITAMHVSGIREFPNGQPPIAFCTPSRLHSSTTEPLGSISFGTSLGTDIAKIDLLNPAAASNAIVGIGEIQGWRPLTIPGDNGAPVKMRGAVTNEVRHGVIVHPSVALPGFGLDNALLADIETKNGDSGAALLDSQNHLLGFLVGEVTGFENFPKLRVFTPAATAMAILNCDIH